MTTKEAEHAARVKAIQALLDEGEKVQAKERQEAEDLTIKSRYYKLSSDYRKVRHQLKQGDKSPLLVSKMQILQSNFQSLIRQHDQVVVLSQNEDYHFMRKYIRAKMEQCSDLVVELHEEYGIPFLPTVTQQKIENVVVEPDYDSDDSISSSTQSENRIHEDKKKAEELVEYDKLMDEMSPKYLPQLLLFSITNKALIVDEVTAVLDGTTMVSLDLLRRINETLGKINENNSANMRNVLLDGLILTSRVTQVPDSQKIVPANTTNVLRRHRSSSPTRQDASIDDTKRKRLDEQTSEQTNVPSSSEVDQNAMDQQ